MIDTASSLAVSTVVDLYLPELLFFATFLAGKCQVGWRPRQDVKLRWPERGRHWCRRPRDGSCESGVWAAAA
jgi:hypothetical protein